MSNELTQDDLILINAYLTVLRANTNLLSDQIRHDLLIDNLITKLDKLIMQKQDHRRTN